MLEQIAENPGLRLLLMVLLFAVVSATLAAVATPGKFAGLCPAPRRQCVRPLL